MLAALLAVAAAAWCSPTPNVAEILRKSVEANEADWKAAPDYDYFERDRKEGGSKTYHVFMIGGSPYQELTAVNGKPLPLQDQKREQRELEKVISQRRSESVRDRAERVAKYERDRKRDRLMMQELTRAFDFKLLGEGRLGHYAVYLLQARPRPGYRPPNIETEVLTGMQGKLWIDKETYQWVRVEAEVVRPVSIEGFLASVQPGTRFVLEKMPVANEIWLPRHFAVKTNARILLVFRRRTQEDETYFNYRRATADQP